MRLRRRIANFALKGFRLRKLQGSRLQKLIRAVLDEIDLQHVRDDHPCASFLDRTEMFRSLHERFINGSAIDYLEFGVFRGDSMRQWASLNANKNSRFFGFDSFEGLPEDWRVGQEKGHFDVHGCIPQIDDPRVKFIKGWFENTIPPFAREFSPGNRLILHMDADLYSSSMLALFHFAPYMSKGTILIFDEFYDRENEFKALMDWQKIFKRRFRIIAEIGNYEKISAELL